MRPKSALRRNEINEFITRLYDGDLHAKRVLSLANGTLGVLSSASLAVHAVGQGLAQAQGTLSKHAVKQVDRLLSNDGGGDGRVLRPLGALHGGVSPGGVGGTGLDELCSGWARDTGVVDVDESWSCDAADVEDGAGIDTEGESDGV